MGSFGKLQVHLHSCGRVLRTLLLYGYATCDATPRLVIEKRLYVVGPVGLAANRFKASVSESKQAFIPFPHHNAIKMPLTRKPPSHHSPHPLGEGLHYFKGARALSLPPHSPRLLPLARIVPANAQR